MEQFILQLGSMSIQAVIVIIAVFLVRAVFAGAGVPKKYVTWLWLVPYIIMICPWKISSVFSFWRIPKQYQAQEILVSGIDTLQNVTTEVAAGQQVAVLDGQADIINGNASINMNFADGEMLYSETERIATVLGTEGGWTFSDILGLVWLLGVATLIIYSVVSYIKLQRKVLCSMRVEDNIYRADDISTAFVLGAIRPKIYLPSALGGENLTYVLEHEKTHIKRRDPLKKILAFGITAVHWFNPLAWVAFYFFCKDMEMACDEETVARIGIEKKQSYAMALLQLSSSKRGMVGVPLAFGEDNVKDRVRNIVKFKKVWVFVSVVAVIVVIVLAVGFLTKYDDTTTLDELKEEEGIINSQELKEFVELQESSVAQAEEQEGDVAPESEATPEGDAEDESEAPENTEEVVEENGDERSEIIPWADLDGDGTEEYILLERGNFGGANTVNGRITMYVNNEPVYQYTEELWIVSVAEKEYIDLDGDGQEEIFVCFGPAVNSMPLVEWFVLKKNADGWEMLEMYHYKDDMSDNAFPITVVLDKKDFQLVIRCEGWEGEIPFDATQHYERRKAELEEGNSAYTAFVEGPYVEGSVVGSPMSWGVWYMQAGTYNGENCLIAEHGLGGPWGKYDYYGNAYVYFNYDKNGKIKILNMEFTPTDF